MSKANSALAKAELTRRLFEEIGRLACDISEAQEDDLDVRTQPALAERQLLQLRRAIRHIGWLADKGSHWNGGIHQLEGATDWLCSPQLRKAISDAEIAVYTTAGHDPGAIDPDAVPA